MSFQFDDNKIISFIINEYKINNQINLSNLYNYLDEELNNNILEVLNIKNDIEKIKFEKIYELLTYLHTNKEFDGIKLIDVIYDDNFIFRYINIDKLNDFFKFYYFKGHFIIDGSINKYIRIKDLSVEGTLDIINSSCSYLEIIDSEIQSQINISLSIDNKECKISLSNISTKLLTVDGSNITDFSLNFDNIYKGYLDSIILNNFVKINQFNISALNNVNIKKINFFKFLCNNNDHLNEYLITNINIDYLYLNSFKNTSDNCNFDNINIKNLLFIYNSYLGKTIFNGVKINSLEIENTYLSECIFNGVKFPKGNKLCNYDDSIDNTSIKDNYRQLKHAMDKSGNHTEANKFYALEMEYYGKTLDYNGIKYSRLVNPLWWIHFIQLIISNYGNNYWLPIMHIFLISFWFTFFSSGYFIIDNNFQHEWLSNLLIIDKKLIENLLTIELVSYKILLGILYYQLIIALKRTTKR